MSERENYKRSWMADSSVREVCIGLCATFHTLCTHLFRKWIENCNKIRPWPVLMWLFATLHYWLFSLSSLLYNSVLLFLKLVFILIIIMHNILTNNNNLLIFLSVYYKKYCIQNTFSLNLFSHYVSLEFWPKNFSPIQS
jgi:hypothetical protein